MTEKKMGKRLSREILGLLVVSSFISLFLFQILKLIASGIIQNFLFLKNIILTETQYTHLDHLVLYLSFLFSVIFFVTLFLFLLGERLSYIRDILKGMNAMQNDNNDYLVPIEGNNELTQLAKTINYISKTQKEMKEKEKQLKEEKEQFIRNLSHDIRTPLTSILSYSELLTGYDKLSPEEQTKYLKQIQAKAIQIKDLSDILLDSGKRKLEQFENMQFLMEQLIEEFEEILEDDFTIETSLDCPVIPGTLDIQELRRIFDNLISNIQKYADKKHSVTLSIHLKNGQLVIQQNNAVRKLDTTPEGYHIGLRSIQHIAQSYDGTVNIKNEPLVFSITITLSNI